MISRPVISILLVLFPGDVRDATAARGMVKGGAPSAADSGFAGRWRTIGREPMVPSGMDDAADHQLNSHCRGRIHSTKLLRARYVNLHKRILLNAKGFLACSALLLALSTQLSGTEINVLDFGAHVTNSANNTNIQIAFNLLDALGGGTLVFPTNRGTYIVTNAGPNPGHRGHHCALVFSNRNPITVDIPPGVTIQLATNAQITGTASNDIIAVVNSTNLTIAGGGTISGGPTNAQPNWTGGYAQSNHGSPIFAQNAKDFTVRNLTINGETHSSHGNVYECTDCLNPVTENLQTFNGGEGILFVRATNVIERFCTYSDPLNVNVGDAHEFADCDLVSMIGCKAFGTNVTSGGSAIDTFGSMNVHIEGFDGDFVYGFAGQPSDNSSNRNVIVSNSRFKVHPLSAQNSGLGGWGAKRNFADYIFSGVTFENGLIGLQTSSNFLGTATFLGCRWISQANAGVYIDGAGIFNFHGGEIIGVANGPGIQAYGNNIADIGSNGPTLNLYGTYIRSNATYGVAIGSQGVANYHVQGDWVAVTFEGNGSGTYVVDGGTTDNIERHSSLAISFLPPNQIQLRWPTNRTCTLESTPNLNAPRIWTTLTNPAPQLSNGQFALTLSATGAANFFRLNCP